MNLHEMLKEDSYGYISKPIDINGQKIHNRLVFQPMEGADGNLDGSISELTKRRYLRFAKSGAGIIWFEAVAVENEGRANPRQLYLNRNNADSFKNLISEIKSISNNLYGYTPTIIMQATHSGRQSNFGEGSYQTIAWKSPFLENHKPLRDNYKIITDEECEQLENSYVQSARLAKEVGFDGIDIKNCHGYLFNEFLSAYNREGLYGGSLENRTRLYLNCIRKVKEENTGLIITTRLGVFDAYPYPYGFCSKDGSYEPDLNEAKLLIQELENLKINVINITIGNPYLNPHVNRPHNSTIENGMVGVERMANIIKELQLDYPNILFILSAPTFLKEKSMNYCENMLKAGYCSLVGFGRMTFAYPNFYQDYLTNRKIEKSKCCTVCGNCTALMRAGSASGCPIRDKEVYLPLYKKFVLGEKQ